MGRKTRILAALLVAFVASAAAAHAESLTEAAIAAKLAPQPATRQTAPSCSGPARARRPAYGWPVKPFHVQHPVRGYFGDPRIGGDPMGSVKTLHFGVDVSAPDGTAVFATASGIADVSWRHETTVSVRRSDGTVFEYWHVIPAVRSGQHVTAYKTVVGHIEDGWAHVHFSEWRAGEYLNPLRPGAMGPYADGTCPAFGQVRFESDGGALSRRSLTGRFDIVAGVRDMPALSAPGPWFDLPVMPALIRWRIVRENGRIALPWRTAFDVRETLPSAAYYAVYTDDTRQNRPNKPGRYRLLLARDVDAASFSPGEYAVQVVAVDTQGNGARSTWSFVIGS
jgi:murein DD-endopeptidase MepM/ murein hydrolase activator NlpD